MESLVVSLFHWKPNRVRIVRNVLCEVYPWFWDSVNKIWDSLGDTVCKRRADDAIHHTEV